VCVSSIGDLLRHALGLTAWKEFRGSRWSLRANPSSGNLHPTEGYLVLGALPGLHGSPGVYHYAADRHALELRCEFDPGAWLLACGGRTDLAILALTSIHWRESWKYGERAFRYCQHDLGHAIAALSLAATAIGWRTALRPGWPHRALAALTGVDRNDDYYEAEREEPGCVLVLSQSEADDLLIDVSDPLVDAVSRGRWHGRASRLSDDHVQWTFIDEVAQVTEWPGRTTAGTGWDAPERHESPDRGLDARRLLIQRRSALAFDGRSSIDRPTFLRMLDRAIPGPSPPWETLWWPPAIHMALFVHRVDDVAPGLYLLVRKRSALLDLRREMNREFLWEPEAPDLPLMCLARGDCRRLAARVSCDQDIAADGYFSVAMIAEFSASLTEFGASFYRHLFWEAGVLGQVLYLEAEAAGARATGIGCFYDDPVHELLGFHGHAFQSLYHFTVGTPVEDSRLTTEPGYAWEGRLPGGLGELR
jgi:SagB-type dehydrogenase family enzyme